MRRIWKRLQGRNAAARPIVAATRRRLSLSRNPDHLYAIGDVHGCLRHLQALEEAIAEDAGGRPGTKLIVLLGDYIDRGPDSAGVIEHLLGPPPTGFKRACLCGNHDDMLSKLLESREGAGDWIRLGGAQTMLSYGYDVEHLCGALGRSIGHVVGEFLKTYPAAHRQFLRRLAVSVSTPSFALVHAGIRPGLAFDAQSDHDLLWIREPAMAGQDLVPGKVLVHGHTPRPAPLVSDDRIAIDTKAYGGGPLTAVRLSGGTPRLLQVQ